MKDKQRRPRSKAKMKDKQSFLSFSKGKLLASKRPALSSESKKMSNKWPNKPLLRKLRKSPIKSTPKDLRPTCLASSSRPVTAVQETPESGMSSSYLTTPLAKHKKQLFGSGSNSGSSFSSDTDYQTPPEDPVEIPTVMKQESFMDKLNRTVRDKFEGPSFDLSNQLSDRRSTQEIIIISSDDDTPPEGRVKKIRTALKRESFMNKLNRTVRDKFEGPSFALEQSSDIRTSKQSTQNVIIFSTDDESCGGLEDRWGTQDAIIFSSDDESCGGQEDATAMKRESFMSKLNRSVPDKFEGPSFDLKLSSDIPTNSRSTRDSIIFSSDDESCEGQDDTTVKPSGSSVIIISSSETSPVDINHQLRDFHCRIINSTPLDRKKKRSVEGGNTRSPKRRATKKEGAVKLEILMKKSEITPAPCKSIPRPSTPRKAALVRKTPRKTSPRRRSTLKNTSSKVIPETHSDSPISASRNKNIQYYFSSSPTMTASPLSPTQDLSSDDSTLSPAQDLSSEGVFSSPVKVQRYVHTADPTSMSLSSAQDLLSDGLFSSPTKPRPLRTVNNKRSPDNPKSPDSDHGLFDSDCPGSTSYFDGFDMDSESDPELKISYNDVDVKQRAEDRLAEILKEVNQTSSSTTPRGGSNAPEDEVAVKYQAAKLKEAERIQQHQEKKEAYYKKLEEEEETKRKQQLMDAPLIECETADVEVFSNDTESIGFAPRHKLLRVMNEASLRPSQVLPRQAVDLEFSTIDVQWLLVKLARETSSVERQHIVPHLQKADTKLTRDHMEKVMKAIGLRYWDKRKGSCENQASAYSVLNKSRRTESMPCTPVKPKRPGRMSSNTPITPVKALRMDSPFSLIGSFDSPASFSMASPSKTAKTPQPPPPFRYRSAESLADFFDTMAQLIEPDCIEFLFRLLLLVSSDSSLDSLQSDTSAAYAGMACLLGKDEFTVEQALELVCDTVDLKSAQTRVLQALFCGTDNTMSKLGHSCASVFFLREYIQGKTAGELASRCSADRSILDATFLDNLVDFSHQSEKPSSYIRHMFGFFAQTMDPTSVKTWKPEQKRKADSALKSRSDFVDNLDDFKFNALVMSWLTRVSTEFIVVEPAFCAVSF
ncbi:hypothetical protein LXG23DRAFT_52766 [Yarrowia lipolytica]|nr:hypothetical protein LXG23DRAFT_52766 [Yarrowia lipolytica]